MSTKYNFKEIEEKWRKIWEENPVNPPDDSKPKYYCLDMFPYPSGNGLHVGHWRGYVLSDVISRQKLMEGYELLHPMGWDAFGLPAENYAIKTGTHPSEATKKSISNIKRQVNDIAAIYDWDKEINTTDPEYYKWTQWIFIQMFKNGLAYEKEMPLNWCPNCKAVLANEEATNGVCDRCGATVTKKNLRQWMLRITKYADRLLNDLDKLDWPEKVKKMQSDWIGKSYGAEIDFPVDGTDKSIKVYTTRPDTLYGATFMVLSPEHPIVKDITTAEYKDAMDKYCYEASTKSNVSRMTDKEKTGVFTGSYGINPLNGAKTPIWVSDYVLADYGTGAIMCVPAHDDRDFEFAKKFDLPIIQVISKDGKEVENLTEAYTEPGIMINSNEFNGMKSEDAKKKVPDYMEEKGFGKKTVNFKLRDWVFSRQRYWGEPIPLVHCDKCGWVPIPESELPLELPEIETFEPGENGESPLAKAYDWIETTCPCCGGKAQRETDTMPQWAGSSWYFLRYMDPHNDEALASKEALEYWSPVDWYNGGMEHTTLHLLYSRFWHKFLYDIGVVPTKEPYMKRTSHGMILGENNEKMSKSRGNVVNPDEVVEEFGADAFRTYEMFIGAFDQSTPWSQQGLKGCYKFLERVWNLQSIVNDEEGYSADLEKNMNKAIKKVGEDFERMKFNTAIATMMSLVNDFSKKGSVTKGEYKTLITLLNPVAPHMTEELWLTYGNGELLSLQPWPKYDEGKTVDDEIEIVVQINGKIKDKLMIPAGLDKDGTQEAAMNTEKIKGLIEGKNVVKVIAVPGKLVNIVVK